MNIGNIPSDNNTDNLRRMDTHTRTPINFTVIATSEIQTTSITDKVLTLNFQHKQDFCQNLLSQLNSI